VFLRSPIVTSRVLGNQQAFIGIDGYTTYCTVRAPGPTSHFQVGFPCRQIVGPGGATNTVGFNAAALAGLGLNNGRQIKDAAGAAPAMIQLTTGTTNPEDFTNPGGGATLFQILNATGTDSAVPYDLKEGMVWSDWKALPAECASGRAYLNVRCYSSSRALSISNDGNGNDYDDGEPDYWSGGYWTNNNLSSATADTGHAASPAYALSCKVRWRLAGRGGKSILVAGDSMLQGYTGSVGAGFPAGRLAGFPRKMRDAMRTAGELVDMDNMARVATHSGVFHRAALQAIVRGGYTHAILQAWSINDTVGGMATPWDIYGAIARVTELLRECEARKIAALVVEPVWNGTAAAVLPVLGTFIDSLEASGVPVLRMHEVICNEGSKTTLRTEYDSGDAIHPNDAGQQALSDAGMALSSRLFLTTPAWYGLPW
jgi:hypothetical protein